MKCLIIFLFAITAVSCDDIHKEFQKSNDLFAASLYKEIVKDNKYAGKNLLLSPLSAETVLALAQSGCRDETSQEIRTVLHLPNDQHKIENWYKTVLPTLGVQSANKIYVKEKFTIRPEFKKIASEVFRSDCENVDFSKKEDAAGVMNQWVEQQTNKKIRDLVSPDVLNNKTRLVLVNALHFKGEFLIPFTSGFTYKENFYTGNDEIQVETMHNQMGENYLYFECHHLNAKFLELPFQNDASVTFILPNVKNGLASLEKQIDRVLVPHNLTRDLVEVSLPKFTIESSFELKNVLRNLGVSKAFDAEADLSGIAGNKGDLIVDSVNQKTFVRVEEGGVEAAAATFAIIPVPPSAVVEPSKHFKADHSFLFYIKIKGVIAFVGRFLTPN